MGYLPIVSRVSFRLHPALSQPTPLYEAPRPATGIELGEIQEGCLRAGLHEPLAPYLANWRASPFGPASAMSVPGVGVWLEVWATVGAVGGTRRAGGASGVAEASCRRWASRRVMTVGSLSVHCAFCSSFAPRGLTVSDASAPLTPGTASLGTSFAPGRHGGARRISARRCFLPRWTSPSIRSYYL